MADVAVQHVSLTAVGLSGETEAITAVSSLDNAFVVLANSRYGSGGDTTTNNTTRNNNDLSVNLDLTNTTTVAATRVAGSLDSNMTVYGQVWEYTGPPGGANEFIVRGRETITTTGTTGSSSITDTPANIDNCIPFITGIHSSTPDTNWNRAIAECWIDDAGNIQIRRGTGIDSVTYYVTVVEFTGSNWTVLHGRQTTSTADSHTITLNTDSDAAGGSTGDVTDWGTAFIVGTSRTVDEGLRALAPIYEPGSGTTTVDVTYESGQGDSHGVFLHVLQNDDMVVSRFTDGSSELGNTNVDITSAGLTTLDTAGIIASCYSSGGGTAYARGWRSYRLTSTTQAQHYCHRSGNTMTHRLQVIDFEALTSASEDYSGPSTVSGNGAPSSTGTKGAQGDSTTSGSPGEIVLGTAFFERRFDNPLDGGSYTFDLSGSETASVDLSGVSAVSGNGSVTVTGERVASGTTAISANGAPTSAGQKAAEGDSAISAGGSITVTGSALEAADGVSVVSGNGAVSSDGQRGGSDAAVITGSGAIAAAGVANQFGTSAVSASGTIATQGRPQLRFDNPLVDGSYTFDYAVVVEATTGSSVSGGGQVVVTGLTARLGTTQVSGDGAITVTGAYGVRGTASITAGGIIASTGEKGGETASQVATGGMVAATGSSGRSGTASVSGNGQVTALGGSFQDAEGASTVAGGGNVVSLVRKDASADSESSAGAGISSQGFKNAASLVAITAGTALAINGDTQRFATIALSGGGQIASIGVVGQPAKIVDVIDLTGRIC